MRLLKIYAGVCFTVLAILGATPRNVNATESRAESPENVALNFKPARLISANKPIRQNAGSTTGWATVDFAIGTDGLPYDLEIVFSTGNKTLEKIVLDYVGETKWAPATANGIPVISRRRMTPTYAFDNPNPIRASISAAFKKLTAEIDSISEKEANNYLQIITTAEHKNSAESILQYLSELEIAKKWGTLLDQNAALSKALSGGERPFKELTKQIYDYVLIERFRVKINLGRYGDALSISEDITNKKLDSKVRKAVLEDVEKIKEMQRSNRQFDASLRLNDYGREHLYFLRGKHFAVVKGMSSIREMTLECDHAFYILDTDQNWIYHIQKDAKNCGLEVIGAANAEIVIREM